VKRGGKTLGFPQRRERLGVRPWKKWKRRVLRGRFLHMLLHAVSLGGNGSSSSFSLLHTLYCYRYYNLILIEIEVIPKAIHRRT
jgi:hypothetical protein